MTTSYRWLTLALLLVLASTLGVQRAARAGDAGAILGGIVAGAIVYELLDDDNYHNRGYYRYNTPRHQTYGYYNTPRRYYSSGPTIVYHDYDHYRPAPRHSYHPPRRGQGLYAAPRGHGRGQGRRYAPPRRYCR